DPSQQNSSVSAATFTVTAHGALTITSNGAAVSITGGDAVSGLLGTFTTSGNSITGSKAPNLTITAGTHYTLNLTVNGTAYTITLAAGTYGTIDALVAEVQKDLNAAMPSVSNVLTFGSAHGLTTGQEVVYHNGGGNSSVGGLTDGNTYYVIKINDFAIQL